MRKVKLLNIVMIAVFILSSLSIYAARGLTYGYDIRYFCVWEPDHYYPPNDWWEYDVTSISTKFNEIKSTYYPNPKITIRTELYSGTRYKTLTLGQATPYYDADNRLVQIRAYRYSDHLVDGWLKIRYYAN